MAIEKIADYELIHESKVYEYQHRRGYVLNVMINHKIYRRAIQVKEYRATFKDTSDAPGIQNPGNLQSSDGWLLENYDFKKSQSQPLTKEAVETWYKRDQYWQFFEDLPLDSN